MQLTIDQACSGTRQVKPQFEIVEVEGVKKLRIHLTKLVRIDIDVEGARRFALRILGITSAEKRSDMQKDQLPLIDE